ncbi:MAG: dodecin family protein [Gemmatimonadota bacterium]|nr:dodecin family protein [Gemmatimonadota bacterium]
MSVHKVIEILAQSSEGFEDAIQQAVAEASETVSGIKNVYVKDMQAVVENNRVTAYRVNVKITFQVADNR